MLSLRCVARSGYVLAKKRLAKGEGKKITFGLSGFVATNMAEKLSDVSVKHLI